MSSGDALRAARAHARLAWTGERACAHMSNDNDVPIISTFSTPGTGSQRQKKGVLRVLGAVFPLAGGHSEMSQHQRRTVYREAKAHVLAVRTRK